MDQFLLYPEWDNEGEAAPEESPGPKTPRMITIPCPPPEGAEAREEATGAEAEAEEKPCPKCYWGIDNHKPGCKKIHPPWAGLAPDEFYKLRGR